MVGRDEAQLVTGDLIARIVAADLPPIGPVRRLHRAAGLRRRRDLLPGRRLAGRRIFGDALFRLRRLRRDRPVDRRRRAPESADGPQFVPGDKTIVIAEDVDTVRTQSPAWRATRSRRDRPGGVRERPESTLILGWNSHARRGQPPRQLRRDTDHCDDRRRRSRPRRADMRSLRPPE